MNINTTEVKLVLCFIFRTKFKMEEVFIQMWSLLVECREYNLSILVSYINETSFSSTGFRTQQCPLMSLSGSLGAVASRLW